MYFIDSCLVLPVNLSTEIEGINLKISRVIVIVATVLPIFVPRGSAP